MTDEYATKESVLSSVGLPARSSPVAPPPNTASYYRGVTAQDIQWRQCRFCGGYAEGVPGSNPFAHVNDCPVARLEAIAAALPAPPGLPPTKTDEEDQARVAPVGCGERQDLPRPATE